MCKLPFTIKIAAVNEPYLILENLSKAYGKAPKHQTVLDNVNFTVDRGECVAVLGHSGCGKSTLLDLIAGIDQADQGRVVINGQNLTSLSERDRTLLRRRHIGFIYQSFNLISTLTAIENIQLPLQLNQFEKATVESRSLEMLQQVGLADKAASFPDQLSGGEQQRVAIARALVHSPSLVLADEHTGNLDADTGRQMLRLFIELAKAQQQTVLMVTHSKVVANSASRILRFADGQLLADSSVDETDLAW